MKAGKKEEAENIKSQVQKINEELVENEKLEEKICRRNKISNDENS